MTINDDLRAPLPYFGGKRAAAPLVWAALGRVKNYVEPFFGSGAVLLSRPRHLWASEGDPGTETVNDASRFLANFWRALKSDPDAVADACDWPVNETDLHSRHRWLIAHLPDLAKRLDADPEAFDAKVAGWWVWGACAWIGSGWCDETRADVRELLPHVGDAGRGIHRKLPHVGDAGCGIHRKLPHVGNAGRAPSEQLPHLSGAQGVNRLEHRSGVRDYLRDIAARLRGVRVACGDWSRVTGDSVTWRHGMTGVFLDPPYAEGAQQYAAGGTGTGLSAEVRAWAIEAGKRPDMRVVLAGLEGEHEFPSDWRVIPWKARGGYGGQRVGEENVNRKRERLWLSPACLGDEALPLFGGAR